MVVFKKYILDDSLNVLVTNEKQPTRKVNFLFIRFEQSLWSEKKLIQLYAVSKRNFHFIGIFLKETLIKIQNIYIYAFLSEICCSRWTYLINLQTHIRVSKQQFPTRWNLSLWNWRFSHKVFPLLLLLQLLHDIIEVLISVTCLSNRERD